MIKPLKNIWALAKRAVGDRIIRSGIAWWVFFSFLVVFLSGAATLQIETDGRFTTDDIKDLKGLVLKLKDERNVVSKFIIDRFPNELRQQLLNGEVETVAFRKKLVAEINRVVAGKAIYDPVLFPSEAISTEMRTAYSNDPIGRELAQLNKQLLTVTYANELRNQATGNLEQVGSNGVAAAAQRRSGVSSWFFLLLSFFLGFLLWPMFLRFTNWLRSETEQLESAEESRWRKARRSIHGFPKWIGGPGNMVPFLHREVIGEFIVLLLFLIAAAVILITLGLCGNGGVSCWSLVIAAVANPGGLFAIVTGIATMLGTYFAVQAIVEMKHTITSYSQLTSRLAALIHEAGESHAGVMFLSYSPIPGAWQVSHKLKNELKAALTNERRRVEFICLTEQDHHALLDRVAKRGTRVKTPSKLEAEKEAFQTECESLLKVMQDKGKREPGHADAQPDAEHYNVAATRCTWSQMPGFYFFVSETRAIVVAPVGLPPPDAATTALQAPVLGSATVETLGFETTDRQIIQMLRAEFRKIEQSVKTPA